MTTTLSQHLGDRATQEDRAAVLGLPGCEVLVIADGMGGHRLGAEAAQAAVEAVLRVARRRARSLTVPARHRVLPVLEAAVYEACTAVEALGSGPRAPGCTLAVAVRYHDRLGVAHVGDSWLAVDHARVTRDHGTGHILSSAIPDPDRVDLHWLRIRPSSRVVLATDGVTGDFDAIGSTAAALVEAQIKRGRAHRIEQDNATVIVSSGGGSVAGVRWAVELSPVVTTPTSPTAPD